MALFSPLRNCNVMHYIEKKASNANYISITFTLQLTFGGKGLL